MSSIKKRIEYLIDQKNIKQYPIGLFTIDYELYEVAKILQNNGILPQAIIYPYVNRKVIEMGIPVYSLNQFSNAFPNAIILIRNIDYEFYKYILNQNGFFINQNIFVDFEIKRFHFYIKKMKKNICNKCIQFPVFFSAKYAGIKKYTHCFIDQISGYNVYRKIRQKYPTQKIYVYDYSGIGDVYVFCMHLSANLEFRHSKDIVLTVIGNSSKRVAKIFDIPNVINLSDSESEKLTHLSRLMGEKLNIWPITPFPSHLHTDMYSHYLYGKKINMSEAYQYVMFSISKKNIKYPVVKSEITDIENFFKEKGLQKGKTLIISPYANTILGYKIEFWMNISEKMKKKGFFVCTNCSGREKEIPGTVKLNFSLEMAEEVIDYAGYFLGLRSGFCDIICNSIAPKFIIYPDYKIFNSNVYEFCSFSKMKIGKNIKEFCWGYQNLGALESKICEAILGESSNKYITREESNG